MATEYEPPPTSEDDAAIGRAFRGSIAVIVAIAAIGGGVWLLRGWMREEPETHLPDALAPTVRQLDRISIPDLPLTDITQQAGIDFVHHNGAAGERLLPETMGSGVAWIDYNNNGHQDLLLINSTDWPWSDAADTVSPPPTCRLYANDGEGNFRDVTEEAGLDDPLYAMGVAIGDYDNDGWTDVFISAVGENRLYKNDRGRFRDVTEEAGVAGAADAWGTSCGFIDYNNDGLLDLFVCNYVQWSREIDLGQSFTLDGVSRAYGPPRAFRGTFPYLYRNEGNGTFRDVSEEAGVQVRNRNTSVPLSKGMGLAPIDIDGDGWIDLIVANDTVQNFLLLNQRDGTFREVGELAGIAYDRDGTARGAMGIDASVFRQDQTLAIAIGNFANEPSALYMARPGRMQFVDAAMATGFGPPTRLALTFGKFFFDVDLDGRLDLLGANGHLEEEIGKFQRTQRYAQPPQLFWNAGPGGGSELVEVPPAKTGQDFAYPLVGRGAAYADIDGDGDLDVILTANGGPARLLRNDQATGHHWVRLTLRGTRSNRDAIGARVELTAGGQTWVRYVMPTRSYLSQCELPVTFGLGEIEQVDQVVVHWPGGGRQSFDDVPISTHTELVEIDEG